jgi:release factor glutamine methyltransferase
MSNEFNKLEYKDYIEGTRKLLQHSRSETEPYNVTVSGRSFIVLPNVFSPKYFNDTELFANNLPVVHGEEMLEIGPGTGAISIIVAYKGAKKVLAIDVNPDAVKNTQANIELHSMKEKIEVRHGNLFEPLTPNEKFDTIFWNTPFGFVENEHLSDLERAVYDPNYKSTERFIKEARRYLKKGGRVLAGFSTTLGRLDLLQRFAEEAGMSMHLLYEVESVETHPVKFELFEFLSPVEK